MGDKRLYKSSENSMLCGVCGGIAEYFDIDPTLVRLAWVILTCFGGAGIWAYIIAAIIIPTIPTTPLNVKKPPCKHLIIVIISSYTISIYR